MRGPALEVVPKPVQPHSAADIRGLEIPLDLQFKAAASLRMKRFISGLQMQARCGSEGSCEIQIRHGAQIPLKSKETRLRRLKVTAACPVKKANTAPPPSRDEQNPGLLAGEGISFHFTANGDLKNA